MLAAKHRLTRFSVLVRLKSQDGQAHILQDKDIPSNVTILRIHGPILFGTTEKFAEATKDLTQFGDVVILRLRNMTALDETGIHALEQFSDRLHKAGKTLLLCGAREQSSLLIARSDFLKHLGTQNVLPHVQAALTREWEISQRSVGSWLLNWSAGHSRGTSGSGKIVR
jgi:sulfate permease, SulP family